MTNLGSRRHDGNWWFGWMSRSTPGIDPTGRSVIDAHIQQIKQVTLLLLLWLLLQWPAGPIERNK